MRKKIAWIAYLPLWIILGMFVIIVTPFMWIYIVVSKGWRELEYQELRIIKWWWRDRPWKEAEGNWEQSGWG